MPVQTYNKKSGVSRKRISDIILGYVFLAPALIMLVVFEFYPLFLGLYISMCNWKTSCKTFIGVDNYTRAFSDPEMWHSLLVTATYSLFSVPVQLGLGLVVAYLLFQRVKGMEWFRMMFFMPYITTTVATAAIWAYLFSPDNGPINKLLAFLGMPGQRWLGETRGIFDLMFSGLGVTLPENLGGPNLALVSLIVYTTWVFLGYDVIIFLAGLVNIPKELYDAAKVDGADGWKIFRYITLPLLSPTTFFLTLITVIGTFKAFNHIYIMTQGGPGDATTTASIFIFQQLVTYNRYGYSAAISFIVFIVILLLTILQNKLAGDRVIYD
jgi:ABC-type sugar transport system permease subunit